MFLAASFQSYGLIMQLNKVLSKDLSALQDFIAFYGLSIVAPLIWLIEVNSVLSGFSLLGKTLFYGCFAINLGFCLWRLSALFRADGETVSSEKAALKSSWSPLFPLICGACWLGMSWAPGGFASGSIIVFILLIVLLHLAVLPLGTRIAFGYSLPMLVSSNLVLLQSVLGESLQVSILLNLAFLAFWYGALRTEGSKHHGHLENKQTDKIDRILSELESSRSAFDEARNSRLELEARMAEKEREMEFTIHERTRELSDANAQLNQQIALRKTIADALVKSQTRLTQAIDASHLGLIDWDVTQGQFYQSAFHEMFGEKEQGSEQVIRTLKRVIHPDDYPSFRDTINQCLAGEREHYQAQYRVCSQSHEDRDGSRAVENAARAANPESIESTESTESWRWIEECGKVVDLDANGNAARILGTRRDIHNEVMRDEQVRLAKSVFDHTSEGVFVLDKDGRFLSINPAYEKISGRTRETLDGQLLQDISETPEKQTVYPQLFAEAISTGQWQGELLEKRYRGDYFPQWMQLNAIEDERGEVKYFAGLVSDLSDRKAADEQLDYLINYDDLTKLANRVQFRDQMHRAVVRYKNDQTPFALVMVDIDRFKLFNDSLGHETADSLLKEIAHRLNSSVQKVDILARVGGNEFACLVACSDTFQVDKFAERLYESVTQGAYKVADTELMLSCSIGVAQVPQDAQDIETLMQNAALAVQKAKYHGGNQIQHYDASLVSFSSYRLELESDLRQALTDRALEVFYQPKLDVKTGLISSLEALIRWDHPSKGRIPPEEFVMLAEENGLISELGAYVLETACEQVQRWDEQGLGELSVSVNLSPRQLRETGLKSVVEQTIQSTGIQPNNLEFELTESAIMDDIQGAKMLLMELRQVGIKISVDDFGTGYSSLSYLKELPVDTLKIDRAFVEGIELSSQQQAIVKAIIVLGHSLELKVVAEGVENDAQFTLLQSLNCDFIQGYYVSKPVSAKDLEKLLSGQREQSIH